VQADYKTKTVVVRPFS